MFFFDEQGWLSQDDAYDSTSLSGSRERFYDERECDIFRSSLSSKPRDKKQHCHLRFCRRPSVEKRFRRVHSFYLLQKNGTSGTNEFLPKMSSNRCCVFIARIDLAKIMKLMLRVSSESKYSFFFQSEGHRTHCWKNGCSRVINRRWTFPVRKSWRASLIFKTWDASRIFAVDLLLPKLAFIS